jgi:Mrp family chromosome partitioning ATPase
MARLVEALHAAGIDVVQDGSDGENLDFARLARLVRERRARTIGLLPVGDDVAVPATAIALGRALAAASGRRVIILDALGGWPGAPELASSDAPEDAPLAATWLLDDVAVVTPRSGDGARSLAGLRAAVNVPWAAFAHVVVDLTGVDHLGEQLEAFALLDAVALVARSGRSTTRQVRRVLAGVAEGRCLGVLLTGL